MTSTSSSEDESYDGFESAEEDFRISDYDYDNDLDDNTNANAELSVPEEELRVLELFNPGCRTELKQKAVLPSTTVPPISDISSLTETPLPQTLNEDKTLQIVINSPKAADNLLAPTDNYEDIGDLLLSKIRVNQEKDKLLDCVTSFKDVAVNQHELEKSSLDDLGAQLVKTLETLTESSQSEKECQGVEGNIEGWNFEDDDIFLPIGSVEDNPSLLSGSCAKVTSNIPIPIERNLGDKFGTDDSGVDNSPYGWDFEEDIDLPDTPERKGSLRTPEKKIGPPKIEAVDNSQTSFNQYQDTTENPAWTSWGGWGVSNLIGSAGVSTLSQMTSGLTSMLETTLGAPDPEVLASQLTTNQKLDETSNETVLKLPEPTGDMFGFGNIIGGVKNLGNKVIDGGLETLETLGKKTMEVLQEGDPGLKKKRAYLFHNEKLILSQVLRDAKEKAEATEEQEQNKISRKAQYETLFDDFHGLVHLEALEMISRQCEIKMHSILSNSPKCSLKEYNEAIELVKSLYDDDEYKDDDGSQVTDELNQVLTTSMEELHLNVNVKNILEVDNAIQCRLKQTFINATDVHTKAISDLAQYTACCIELFHRIAELLIVRDIYDISMDFKALSRVASVSRSKIGNISESYSAKLMVLPDKSTSPLITNIFLEGTNSSSYVDNAFELLAPVLQVKALLKELSLRK